MDKIIFKFKRMHKTFIVILHTVGHTVSMAFVPWNKRTKRRAKGLNTVNMLDLLQFPGTITIKDEKLAKFIETREFADSLESGDIVELTPELVSSIC